VERQCALDAFVLFLDLENCWTWYGVLATGYGVFSGYDAFLWALGMALSDDGLHFFFKLELRSHVVSCRSCHLFLLLMSLVSGSSSTVPYCPDFLEF
jgi:hypothetical protein